MKIGIVQMSLAQGNPDANYQKVEQMVKSALKKMEKPEVFLLPELWSTGYDIEKDKFRKLASPEGKEPELFLKKLAKQYNIWFVGGSVSASTSEGLKCRAQIINPQGKLVSHYDKIHLFSGAPYKEHETFTPGNKLPEIFLIDKMKSASVICYDIRFCELIRKLALNGTQLLFVSSSWPLVRLDHWRYILIAMAIENQMYVVASTLTGETNGHFFSGHSMAIDPWGEIIGELDEEAEDVIVVDVNVEKVEEVRNKIPIFADRKPKIYQL